MFKTLAKHAVKRKTIPILTQICVEDGVATTTDMDFWISVPVSLEDGMYYAEGFDKGIQIKSDLPISDFPAAQIEKKKQATTNIPKSHCDALGWVLKAASTEAARYYLNGVFFDWAEKDAIVVATDGHRRHSFKHHIDGERPKKVRKKQHDGKFKMILPNTGAIMPRSAVKIILDLMKELKADNANIVFFETTFIAEIGPALVAGKLIDGMFPDWRRVCPEHPKQNRTVFDPEQVQDILPEMMIIKKIDCRKTIPIQIKDGKIVYSSLNGIDREWPCTVKWDIAACFNLKFLSELCAGEMHYTDPSSPFTVVGWPGQVEKTAVLMPMRV